MKKTITIITFLAVFACSCNKTLRPVDMDLEEAVSILALDPHIQATTNGRDINFRNLQHSNKRILPLTGILKVDGKVYRFLGDLPPDPVIAHMGIEHTWIGDYTFIEPAGEWQTKEYQPINWLHGAAPFGSLDVSAKQTVWQSKDIWVRRSVIVDPAEIKNKKLYLKYSHDDVCEIFINGIRLVKTGYEWHNDIKVQIPEHILESCSDGVIVISSHCENLKGGAYLDFGIYEYSRQENGSSEVLYTNNKPSQDWLTLDYDDHHWAKAKMPMGKTKDMPCSTDWSTSDIWIRKNFFIDTTQKEGSIVLRYSFDDAINVYVNGIQLVENDHKYGYDKGVVIPQHIIDNATDCNLLVAAHCHNKTGSSFIDFRLEYDNVASVQNIGVTLTQTKIGYRCGPVQLDLNFTAPLVLYEPDIFTLPLNFISYNIHSLDNEEHNIEVYFDASPEIVQGSINNSVASVYRSDNLTSACAGRMDQTVFFPMNEYLKINWGYLHLAGGKSHNVGSGNPNSLRKSFITNAKLPATDTSRYNGNYIAITENLGKVKSANGKIAVAFDEIYAIKFLGDNIRPYWNNGGNKKIEDVIEAALNRYGEMKKRCDDYDSEVMLRMLDTYGQELGSANIKRYKEIASSFKLVKMADEGLFIFPEGRKIKRAELLNMFFDINPELVKYTLAPIFYYCNAAGDWERNYPPEELGLYPFAGRQRDMAQNPILNTTELLHVIGKLKDKSNYNERELSIIKTWLNFLKTSNPNPDKSSEWQSVRNEISDFDDVYWKKRLK